MYTKKLLSRDINFFAAVTSRDFDRKRSNRNAIVFLIIFLAVVAIAYPTITYKMKNTQALEQIADQQAYLSSSKYTDALAAALSNQQLLSDVTNYISGVKTASEKFDSLQKPTSGMFNTITAALGSGVTVNSVKYDDGVIELECSSANLQSPPIAVESLQKTGAFEYVVYTGMNKTGDIYGFTIECKLIGEDKG